MPYKDKEKRKEYHKTYSKKWDSEHRERRKLQARIYRKKNPEKQKEYDIKWKENNPDKVKTRDKRHYKKNIEKILLRKKTYRKENLQKIKEYNAKFKLRMNKWREDNKEDIKIRKNIYHLNHKQERKEYNIKNRDRDKKRQIEYNQRPETKIMRRKTRYKYLENNPQYRIHGIIAAAIRKSLKTKPCKSTESILGYTIKKLKIHLEKQFSPEMNWNNYAKFWEIDHRIPKSWFTFTSYEDIDFKKCWSIENLQPKLKSLNREKKNTFAEPTLAQLPSIS